MPLFYRILPIQPAKLLSLVYWIIFYLFRLKKRPLNFWTFFLNSTEGIFRLNGCNKEHRKEVGYQRDTESTLDIYQMDGEITSRGNSIFAQFFSPVQTSGLWLCSLQSVQELILYSRLCYADDFAPLHFCCWFIYQNCYMYF